MAWIRMCGGAKKPSFPWDAYNDGVWNRKTASVTYGTPQYITCATSSPQIVSGCTLVASLSGSDRLQVKLEISTDGVTWNTAQVVSYQSTFTFTYALTNYVGSPVYVRFKVESGYQTGTYNITLNSCTIAS